jgi:hypothetical protein
MVTGVPVADTDRLPVSEGRTEVGHPVCGRDHKQEREPDGACVTVIRLA